MPNKAKKLKKPPAELDKIVIEPPTALFTRYQLEIEADIKEMDESGFKDNMFAVKSRNLKLIAAIDVKLKAFSRKYIWDNYGRPNRLYPPQKEIEADRKLYQEKNRLYKEYQDLANQYFGKFRARKVWAEINGKLPRAQKVKA